MKLLHLLFTFLILFPTLTTAQVLVKDHLFHPQDYTEDYFDVEQDFIFKNEFRLEPQHSINEFAARYEFDQMELKLPAEYADFQVRFFGHHDNGQYAVSVKIYDDLSADYVLHMYNNLDRCYSSVNLSDMTGRFNRITHLVYYRGFFYFNCEAPDGQVGDVEHYAFYYVYCYDPEKEALVWESDCQTSRGEFLIDDIFIYAGFGGSDCDDFVTLLKRDNGQMLCKAPVPSQPTAAGMAQDTVFFVDYNLKLHRFLVKDRGVRVMGTGVRLRRGPGTQYDIFTDPYTDKTAYPLQNDVLQYLGEEGDWFKVRYMDETLYISKQFAEIYVGEIDNLSSMAYQDWNQAVKQRCGRLAYHPYFEMIAPFESEERAFLILANNQQAAVFLYNDMENAQLIVEGDLNEIRVYPEVQSVHFYAGNAIGLEDDRIYITENGKVTEIWQHNVRPLGNINTAEEVDVEETYTCTSNGKTRKVTAEEFEAVKDAVVDTPMYDIEFDI